MNRDARASTCEVWRRTRAEGEERDDASVSSTYTATEEETAHSFDRSSYEVGEQGFRLGEGDGGGADDDAPRAREPTDGVKGGRRDGRRDETARESALGDVDGVVTPCSDAA